MNKLRVLLVDDHPLMRSGLKTLIDSQTDMEVVGEAYEGDGAVRSAQALNPDVVVMDVSMPGVGGAEATGQIRGICPQAKILALTAHEDRGYLHLMLKAGATGYTLKRVVGDDLVRAIRTVAAGETYIDPAVAGQLVSSWNNAPADPSSPAVALSERESEVLRLISRGLPVKTIAHQLDVGVRTVETYKSRGMDKLGLKTRADLVPYALQKGWLADG